MSRKGANFPTGEVEFLLISPHANTFLSVPVPNADFSVRRNTMVGNVRHAGRFVSADIRSKAFRKGHPGLLNRQSISVVGSQELDEMAQILGIEADVALRALRRQADANEHNLRLKSRIPFWPHARAVRSALDYQRSLVDGIKGDSDKIKRLFLAQCLGANVVVNFNGTEIAPSFRAVPRGTDFGSVNLLDGKLTGPAVSITRPNWPCVHPGRLIERSLDVDAPSGIATRFAALRSEDGENLRGHVGMVVASGKMAVGETAAFYPLGEPR